MLPTTSLRCPGCLALLLLAGCGAGAPTVIVVEADYPGANALTGADTLAAVEQQVNGVEKLVYLRSRADNNGRYTLVATFAAGTDPAIAQVLVQNRVALALPLLPEIVKRGGVTVKKAPGPVRFIVAVTSPKGTYDTAYLGNYATLHVKDELARLTGVGAATQLPEGDSLLRIWLDPQKLAARKLDAKQVAEALQQQNLTPARPVDARAERIDLQGPGRLRDPEELADVILKVTPNGGMVRLRDVAHIELSGPKHARFAQLNGKPAVLVFVTPLGKQAPSPLQEAVRKHLALLARHAPNDLRLDLAFDFTAAEAKPGDATLPEYLLLDVQLPAAASAERVVRALRDVAAELAKVDGVRDVAALSASPFGTFESGPCLLVRLAPRHERDATRHDTAARIRERLADNVPTVALRIRYPLGAPPFTGWDYPIRCAIHGPEAAEVRRFAAVLDGRMQKEKQLTDGARERATDVVPMLDFTIDRARANQLGVVLPDAMQVLAAVDLKARDDIEQLKVRTKNGKMVPLSAFAKVREVKGPAAVERFNLQPMIALAANPAPGVALAEARALCTKLADTVRTELKLSTQYRLSWLDVPARK